VSELGSERLAQAMKIAQCERGDLNPKRYAESLRVLGTCTPQNPLGPPLFVPGRDMGRSLEV